MKNEMKHKKAREICEDCGEIFETKYGFICQDCRRKRLSDNAKKIHLNELGNKAYSEKQRKKDVTAHDKEEA